MSRSSLCQRPHLSRKALTLQYVECPVGSIEVLNKKMFDYFGVTALKDMLSHFFPTIQKKFFAGFALQVVEGTINLLLCVFWLHLTSFSLPLSSIFSHVFFSHMFEIAHFFAAATAGDLLAQHVLNLIGSRLGKQLDFDCRMSRFGAISQSIYGSSLTLTRASHSWRVPEFARGEYISLYFLSLSLE